MNRATLVGFLGADPETRRLASGDPVVNLRLATSESWKDKATGERKSSTEWHQIVIYNENVGRIVEQYAKKGARILIEGQIRTRKFTDNAGVEKYRTEIVLGRFSGTVELLDRAERQQHGPEAYGTTSSRGSAEAAGGGSGGGRPSYDLDDDIPF